MDSAPRHKCLVYSGPPSKHLGPIAAAASEMLLKNYRCLYLNNKPMVAGFCSYLAARGIDVESAVRTGALVLSSDQTHLIEGQFHVDAMLENLKIALIDTLKSGYAGLWASGDMTWEFGPEKNYTKLVEYEYRLEEFLRSHAEIRGICQYHVESLPADVVHNGVNAHECIFVNESLSLMNPDYIPSAMNADCQASPPVLGKFIRQILELPDVV